jgi:inorganic pyrophosphatase
MNKDVLIQKFRNSSEDAKDQLNKTFDNYKNLENNRKELNSKHIKLEEQLAIK